MSADDLSPVLILAAEGRAALACIRSLGKSGIPMVLASDFPHAPGFYSRYARGRPICRHTDPYKDADKYVDDVLDICRAYGVRLILPQSERSLIPLIENREKWPSGVTIPIANNNTFYELQDKLTATHLMQRFEVPVPTTWTSDTIQDHLAEISFPCMMKPRRSIRAVENGSLENLAAKWICDEASLLEELQRSNIDRFFFQEYKRGHGGAIYLLMWEGECLARLDQITLRQQAGPGSVTQAISGKDIYPVTAEKAQKALNSVGWSGVIMLELRVNPDTKTAYFIECNPRFWGPTQLALDSGVDFPLLLFRAASHQQTQELPRAVETGYTWKIGHWYSRFFERAGRYSDVVLPIEHNSVPDVQVKEYKDIFFRWEDPLPALYEFKRTLLGKGGRRVLDKLKSLCSGDRPRHA